MRGPRAPLLPPCGPPLNPYPEQPLIPLPARMRLSYAPGQRPAQAGPPFPPTETPPKNPKPPPNTNQQRRVDVTPPRLPHTGGGGQNVTVSKAAGAAGGSDRVSNRSTQRTREPCPIRHRLAEDGAQLEAVSCEQDAVAVSHSRRPPSSQPRMLRRRPGADRSDAGE